jgi:small subunit ribosomal protein S15
VIYIARLHSKKKGKSGTKRPKSNISPEWSSLTKAQAKEIALKLAKEGVAPSKIGIILRDKYATPNVKALLGVPLSKFLSDEGALPELPEDMANLMRKVVRLQEHIKTTGKADTHNKVKMSHVESKIARLVKYYHSKGKLPAGWKYDKEKVALLVK